MAGKTSRSALDAEIQDLYAQPLAEFTAARNDLAKRLQKAGDREAATEVKSLAKPTASAWAVNRLFQEEKERMAALLAAGAKARDALRHTLAHGEAEALREALQEERALRDDLRRRAGKLLGRAGQAILDRVGTNLDALALSPAAAGAAERGWLDVDLDPPGFEVLSGLSVPAAPSDRRGLRLVPSPPAKKEAPARKPEPAKAAPARDREAEKRAAEEEKRQRQAEAAREREEARLRDELARVEEKAERASAEELSFRREAERAEKEAAEAEKAAAEAARRAEAARQAAERASQRAERAARELERAQGHVEAARQRLASRGD